MRLLATAVLLVCAAAHARELTIHVEPVIQATVAARAVAGGETATAPVIDGVARLPLAEGSYEITASADGWWLAPAYVTVGRRELLLRAWPRTAITGTFRAARALPSTVAVRFSYDGGVAEIECPLDDGRWRCEVPAMPLDLRVRARGFLTQFFPSIEPHAGAPLDLGRRTLLAGGSITGSVVREDGTVARGAAVQITAAGTKIASSRTDERGAFNIGALAAGAYRVTVIDGGAAAAPVDVTVRENGECELLAPMRLLEPRALTVAISPERDPADAPWHVRIARKSESGERWDIATEGAADAGGRFETRLGAGVYAIAVAPADDPSSAWATVKTMLSADSVQPISLDLDTVDGSVRLGEQPLAAGLEFHSGARRVTARAGDDGRFRVPLPRDVETWSIRIDSDAPRVKREVTAEITAARKLDLVLPATFISGDVFDERGSRVEQAIVTITSLSEPLATAIQATVRGGAFVANGVGAGRYRVQAASFAQEQSDAVEVTVGADEPAVGLRLDVRRSNRFDAAVSALGSPVAGAEVIVAPVETLALANGSRRTDASGRVSTLLPNGTRTIDVAVAAPGFAFRMFRTALAHETAPVPVSSTAGTLVVEVPDWRADTDTPQPFVMHGGAVLPLQLLATRWGGRFDETAPHVWRMTVPMLEPGEYRVCSALRGRGDDLRPAQIDPRQCGAAIVPPFGEGRISLPPRDS